MHSSISDGSIMFFLHSSTRFEENLQLTGFPMWDPNGNLEWEPFQPQYRGYLQSSPCLPALVKHPFTLATCLSTYQNPAGITSSVPSSFQHLPLHTPAILLRIHFHSIKIIFIFKLPSSSNACSHVFTQLYPGKPCV